MPTPDPLPGMDDTDELLTIHDGVALLAELTRGSQVPVSAENLLYSSSAVDLGCVLVGDVPVRPVKSRGRWCVPASQVRQAADAVRSVRIVRRDLVPVRLPIPPQRRTRPAPKEGTWRSRILESLERETDTAPHRVSDCPALDGAGGSHLCVYRTVGATQFRHLAVWHKGEWCLPRAYADLLDRWQLQNDRAREEALRCSRCGQTGPSGGLYGGVSWEWREQSETGYATVCPDCVTAETRPYADELHGVQYAKKRFRSAAVRFWRCLICERRAMYIDHCHDHGYVRGPLCQTCNTREAAESCRPTISEDAATWLRHLRRCVGCQAANTLPLIHVAYLGASLAVERSTPRQGRGRIRCRHETTLELPKRQEFERDLRAGLPLRITLRCWRHEKEWKKAVPLPELLELVRAYVVAVAPDLGE